MILWRLDRYPYLNIRSGDKRKRIPEIAKCLIKFFSSACHCEIPRHIFLFAVPKFHLSIIQSCISIFLRLHFLYILISLTVPHFILLLSSGMWRWVIFGHNDLRSISLSSAYHKSSTNLVLRTPSTSLTSSVPNNCQTVYNNALYARTAFVELLWLHDNEKRIVPIARDHGSCFWS